MNKHNKLLTIYNLALWPKQNLTLIEFYYNSIYSTLYYSFNKKKNNNELRQSIFIIKESKQLSQTFCMRNRKEL
jgi:hypothetical protein